jgi:seryl-tRNA synthetase
VGTGYLPQSEEDLYKTQDNDYLAGTAEVSTMGYYMNEIIDKKNLPIKFFSFLHVSAEKLEVMAKIQRESLEFMNFIKYEQVVLCEASHEESVRFMKNLQKTQKLYLQELNIPYHVVVNCGGDLGLGASKKIRHRSLDAKRK